ncbi:MAG: T9SS type A sorting domain-containing protein, partial [Saprospiraceae bacterium]|nr:T9SS type A sorting domain-containing protein [Saprospiraceae bacterium]
TEARFDGDPDALLLSMSAFNINTADQNSQLWATPRIPAVGWFGYSGHSPSNLIHCVTTVDDPPREPHQAFASQMVINGTFESYKGYPATTWDASLYAFSELIAQPEWRPDGSLNEQFYNLHNTGNVGKLQRAREAWDNIALFSSTLESNWSSNQAAISQKLDELLTQSQLMQNSQIAIQQVQISQTMETLKNDLTELQALNQSLSTQFSSEVNARGSQLLTDLSAISTTMIWEANLKSVLALLAQRQIENTTEWTNEQESALLSIANQCRHEGGIGVVLARAAINKFDYNDEAMCPGYTQPRSDNGFEVVHAILSPNPASNLCQIRFDKALSGTLTICNLQGQVLRSLQLSNTLSLDIDTESLPTSLYVVQIKTDAMPVWSAKLTISH